MQPIRPWLTFLRPVCAILGAFLVAVPVTSAEAAETFFSAPLTAFTLEADLETLFKDERSKNVPAKVKLESAGRTWTVTAKVKIRGQTSREDCSFKKLSLELDGPSTRGTPLEGLTKLSLNTHCSENTASGYTPGGRVAGGQGPVREAFVLEWRKVLGITGAQHKLVNAVYVNPRTRTRSQYPAVIFESKGNLSTRLGGKIFEEEDVEDQVGFLDQISEHARNEMTLLGLMLNALIGNADYSLQLSDLQGERRYNPVAPPSGFHNMLIVDYGNNSFAVLPVDFDMARAVRQTRENSYPLLGEISGCQSVACEHQFAQIQKWRAFFPAAVMKGAIAHFLSKERELKAAVQISTLSTSEKGYLKQLVDSMVDVLRNRYQVPVLMANSPLYKDNQLRKPCLNVTASSGLPVKVLETTAKGIRALILDTRDGSLTDPDTMESCEGEVWLPAGTKIGANWP